MSTELQPGVSFEQAFEELGAIYEDTKQQLVSALYALGSAERNMAIEKAMANNVQMRDFAAVALRRLYMAEDSHIVKSEPESIDEGENWKI